jgi:transcriptional regulator with XRE-family HTH domain
MTLGDKIRLSRLDRKMTQSDVAEGKITRNMLSAIEANKALPSLDTLKHISEKLEVPLAYLLSNDYGLSVYRKNEIISDIRRAFSDKHYLDCIALINSIGGEDDELTYILAYANYELGVAAAKNGAFFTAENHLSLANKYSRITIYDTKSIEYKIPLYLSFVKNVNAPLLEFDKDAFFEKMVDSADFEFYKYLCNDTEYSFTNHMFKQHMVAKMKIRERKYYDAIKLLKEIAESKSSFEYNAYLLYGVYGDLDNCYKQIFDFENAYKYSVKRLSMLEGFRS